MCICVQKVTHLTSVPLIVSLWQEDLFQWLFGNAPKCIFSVFRLFLFHVAKYVLFSIINNSQYYKYVLSFITLINGFWNYSENCDYCFSSCETVYINRYYLFISTCFGTLFSKDTYVLFLNFNIIHYFHIFKYFFENYLQRE